VRFGDAFEIELDINEISDTTVSAEEAQRQVDAARPRRGGVLWPEQLNASTVPVLHKVKQDIHKQMQTLLFDDVLVDAILVVNYILNVVLPVGMSMTRASIQALQRATLSGRWMKGSQVIKGAAPPAAAAGSTASTTTETAAQTARALAKKLADEGKPVIANIGGTGASHEPVDAININNQAVPRKSIPNHVLADGADIGELLEPGKVDRVEGHNMAPGILDWERAAPGINRVLKPGGKVNYYVRGADPDLEVAAQKLRDLGWKDVITRGEPGKPPSWLLATKP
jgi:hypothetical protein